MAYSVSSAFRTKCYSGSSNYRAILTIDGTLVPNSQIAKIEMSNPIIDSGNETFYLGTFISNQITIKFKNLNNLNIQSNKEVYLQIGQYIDATNPSYQYTTAQHNQGYIDGYEYVPIGYFLIDELAENYQETCEITCLDYAVKFKQSVDYSDCFTDGSATIDTILRNICAKCGVSLDENFPTTNGTVLMGTYDNTISGKQWISYIAEIKGCNAKIGRDGKLYLIPLKQTSSISINAKKGKSWALGEKYELSQIKYYNNTRWLESPTSVSNPKNILYLRQDNPFIQDDQTFIDNIYNVLNGLIIYNITCENFGDISLDCWDNITYTLDNNSYQTLNNNTNTYEMSIMTKVDNTLPTKQVEETTNVIKEDAIQLAKKVQTTVDTINGTITTLTSRVETVENDYVKTTSFEQYQDDVSLTFATKTQLTDGSVTKAVSTNFVFDEDGLTTSATESDTNIQLGFQKENDQIVKEGLSIKTKSDKEILFAGFDKSLGTDGETIVRVDNLTTNHYQVSQYDDENVWRQEIINDDTNGLGYAFFYIGDD